MSSAPEPTAKTNSPWLTVNEAAELLRVSRDTINRHRVPWTDALPPRGKFRYKMAVIGSKAAPRILREDLERILENPLDTLKTGTPTL